MHLHTQVVAFDARVPQSLFYEMQRTALSTTQGVRKRLTTGSRVHKIERQEQKYADR
jgi:hypothetical protein